MLKYNKMIKCEIESNRELEKTMLKIKLDKYKYFIEYIKKVVEITFKDEEEAIVSYIDKTPAQYLLLRWDFGDCYELRISSLDGSIYVSLLRAYHKYNCPVLDLTRNLVDEELLMFFGEGYERGYRSFENVFIPTYRINGKRDKYLDEYSSIVWRISRMLNEAIYKWLSINHSESLKIKTFESFMNSKYSLSFSNDRRRELDIEVYNCYDAYNKQVKDLSKQFDEGLK